MGWGGAPEDFLEYCEMLSGGAAAKKYSRTTGFNEIAIHSSQRCDNAWPDSDTSNPMGNKMREIQIRIGEISASLIEWVSRQKEGTEFRPRNYRRNQNGVGDVVKDLLVRY